MEVHLVMKTSYQSTCVKMTHDRFGLRSLGAS